MMKKVMIGLLVLVVVVAAGLLVLGTRLDGIVAGLIEKQGSAATQTAVRVGGVSIRLREAAASISSLTVANPEGFDGNALEMDAFAIKLDASTLMDDPIVIKEVLVADAQVNVIQRGRSNNLRQLLNNLQRAEQEPASEAEGPKLVIERFTLEGAGASIALPDLGESREVELPTIVVRDIGRASNGATGAQVAAQVLEPLVRRALESAAADSVRDRVREELGDAAGGLLDRLGEAVGGSREPERDERD